MVAVRSGRNVFTRIPRDRQDFLVGGLGRHGGLASLAKKQAFIRGGNGQRIMDRITGLGGSTGFETTRSIRSPHLSPDDFCRDFCRPVNSGAVTTYNSVAKNASSDKIEPTQFSPHESVGPPTTNAHPTSIPSILRNPVIPSSLQKTRRLSRLSGDQLDHPLADVGRVEHAAKTLRRMIGTQGP